jgi:hypothetical protein
MNLIKLTWARTVIGGQTKPHDFAAQNGDEHVGRILCIEAGPRAQPNRFRKPPRNPRPFPEGNERATLICEFVFRPRQMGRGAGRSTVAAPYGRVLEW